MSKLALAVALASIAGAAALEPVVPPIALQEVQQASLPAEVHINFDVPTFGLISDLAEQKKAADSEAKAIAGGYQSATSFLEKGFFSASAKGTADVFFEAPQPETAYEASYQSLLASMQRSIDGDFAALRASVSGRGSFLRTPSRDPQINLTVESSKGKLVDVDRLRSDLYAYAKNRISSLEDEILRSA